MKRRVKNNDNEPNKRCALALQKKFIINIYSNNSLPQDNYNMIFQQTEDYRSLFPLLFITR
jgi:hypothetical protein